MKVPGGGLTFSKSGGVDDDKFTLDSETGDVSFVTPPDFESPDDNNGDRVYELQVTVTDGGGNTAVQDISITVTDVNTAIQVIKFVGSIGGNDFLPAEDPGNPLVLPSPGGAEFVFGITNAGTAPLENIRVVDAALGIDITLAGTLLPGITSVVSASDVPALAQANYCDTPGDRSNTVTVTADSTGPEDEAVNDSATAHVRCLIPAEPLVTIEKQLSIDFGPWLDADSPVNVDPNSSIRYRFEISNVGTDDLNSVTITDVNLGLNAVPNPALLVGEVRILDSTTPGFESLDFGEVFCEGSELFENTASVDAVGIASGTAVSDSDPADFICSGFFP